MGKPRPSRNDARRGDQFTNLLAERLKGNFRVTRRQIAFDLWNWAHLRPWLARAGFSEQTLDKTFVPFGQGYKSMSPAVRDLETLILEKKLRHGGNPVLTMCVANAAVERGDAGNRSSRRNDRRAALTARWRS